MNCDSSSQNDEEESERPMVSHKDGTVQKGDPDQAHRQHLDFQRYSLILHKVADIGPQPGMIQKPVVKSPVASQEKRCCQKKQGGRRKDREEYSQYAKPESQKT